jgi:acetyl esterase/lipase
VNRRSWMLIYLTVLSIAANHANAQQQGRSMRELVMMPVVYRVPGMDKVKVKSDLKYTTINNPFLLMDVYTPPDLAKGEKRPAVILIHGGAGEETTPKDWGFYVSWGKLIAASGMVGVTFTHRLSAQKASLAVAAGDVTAAVNYIRSNAESLNVDRERICLVAYSAGGPMLSMVMRDKPAYVRCMVAFYAFMDIQQAGNLFEAHESPETVRSFSPIRTLANDADRIAPLFIARAGRDQVPTMDDSIDRFIREAVSKNVPLTFANHPQGVHSFDSQNDDNRSREIIKSAIAFMKANLGIVEIE